ncbi:ty3-gypsy retrotransposon protein [Cucumis melo var. makuwa]|uniref:Ty3-gypsy retrotransposon protein n=1 Tax=Cucumis melo var. makuwa TaxID=1194695 RepID=A0A5A7U6F1_CUCMM|nr:ty3-gypsy retrotransposon protein [Cucumis melo var. makuwa]
MKDALWRLVMKTKYNVDYLKCFVNFKTLKRNFEEVLLPVEGNCQEKHFSSSKSNDSEEITVQTRIEERLELIEQEVVMMKKEIIEEAAADASTNDGVDSEGAISNQRMNNRICCAHICVNERERERTDQSKFKKVEMPVSTGDNPDSWLFRAERSSRDGTTLGKFLRIKQETTVEEYRNLFNKLVAPVSDVQEKVVEDTFMNGLLAELAFYRPKGLAKMMQVARLVKNKELIRKEASLNGFSGGKYPPQTISSSKPTRGNTLSENEEFQARKEKGLCFRCNKKYSADHKCKMKELRELRMFVVVGEKEEYEIVEENEPAEKGLAMLEVKDDNKAFVELSINSVVGLNDPGTMKVRGKLRDMEIIIMIDCGATHNFISEKLVKSLQITTKETAHYGVILGSGTAIQGKGVCKDVEIQLADWTLKEDFLPLELGGADVILGMQWLHSLGVIAIHWKNLTFAFTGNGKHICIKGDPSLTKARISLKSMFRIWGDQDEGF